MFPNNNGLPPHALSPLASTQLYCLEFIIRHPLRVMSNLIKSCRSYQLLSGIILIHRFPGAIRLSLIDDSLVELDVGIWVLL